MKQVTIAGMGPGSARLHDTGGLPGSKTGRRFNRFRTPDCAVYRSKNG